MGHLNWMLMSEKGIAGDGMGIVTCFVAALDCLLNDGDIPFETYQAYTDAYHHQRRYGVNRRRSRNVFREVLQSSIGGSCLKNLVCKRASTPEDMYLTLTNAIQGNKKIIIRVTSRHVVGLKPIRDNIWLMVGNSLPYDDELTTEEVFSFLHIPHVPRKTAHRTNIYLIC